MTAIDRFRQDPEKVGEMRKVLSMPIVQEWLAVMQASAPQTTSAIEADITPTMAQILLGIIRGYTKYHNFFQLGGVHHTPATSVESAALALEPET